MNSVRVTILIFVGRLDIVEEFKQVLLQDLKRPNELLWRFREIGMLNITRPTALRILTIDELAAGPFERLSDGHSDTLLCATRDVTLQRVTCRLGPLDRDHQVTDH